jgi:hypothetical protein
MNKKKTSISLDAQFKKISKKITEVEVKLRGRNCNLNKEKIDEFDSNFNTFKENIDRIEQNQTNSNNEVKQEIGELRKNIENIDKKTTLLMKKEAPLVATLFLWLLMIAAVILAVYTSYNLYVREFSEASLFLSIYVMIITFIIFTLQIFNEKSFEKNFKTFFILFLIISGVLSSLIIFNEKMNPPQPDIKFNIPLYLYQNIDGRYTIFVNYFNAGEKELTGLKVDYQIQNQYGRGNLKESTIMPQQGGEFSIETNLDMNCSLISKSASVSTWIDKNTNICYYEGLNPNNNNVCDYTPFTFSLSSLYSDYKKSCTFYYPINSKNVTSALSDMFNLTVFEINQSAYPDINQTKYYLKDCLPHNSNQSNLQFIGVFEIVVIPPETYKVGCLRGDEGFTPKECTARGFAYSSNPFSYDC